MLVGHEVSHALYTPSDSWKEMAKRSKEFKMFVNVIEDLSLIHISEPTRRRGS